MSAGPVSAQNGPKVPQKALEHSTWNVSPREFQIIDDRPIIKDFREAPRVGGTIDIPPPPQGFGGGAGGGNGPGALGGGPGASLPGGGVGAPGSWPAYRGDPPGLQGLPKSGFGRDSNIPARGMGPGGRLPGVTQGVIGKLMNQAPAKGQGAGAPRGMAPPTQARTTGNSSTPVATYNGGYGTGSGSAYGGSSSKTEASVRGSLLRK